VRVIIAGGRDITDASLIVEAVAASGFQIASVVSGGASGVDSLGEDWARKCCVPVARFPADWKAHGRAAGPKRNREMAENADALIAIWDGASRGTKNMIETAQKLGLKVFVYRANS